MPKRRSKAAPISWGRIALVCVGLVVPLVLGIWVGVASDPLPPQTCATRLAQLGAPPGVDQFVCYGRRPN